MLVAVVIPVLVEAIIKGDVYMNGLDKPAMIGLNVYKGEPELGGLEESTVTATVMQNAIYT